MNNLDLKYAMIPLIFIFYLSCQKPKNDLVNKDFEHYSIKIPESWSPFIIHGIDSKAYGFITPSKDTIFTSFGENAIQFDETVQVFSYEQISKYNSIGLDTKNLYYSKKPSVDEAQGAFLNEYYYYDTIDGLMAKFIMPKRLGDGFTGITFDSIDSKSNRLVLYGKDLDTLIHFKLLNAFKTIEIN